MARSICYVSLRIIFKEKLLSIVVVKFCLLYKFYGSGNIIIKILEKSSLMLSNVNHTIIWGETVVTLTTRQGHPLYDSCQFFCGLLRIYGFACTLHNFPLQNVISMMLQVVKKCFIGTWGFFTRKIVFFYSYKKTKRKNVFYRQIWIANYRLFFRDEIRELAARWRQFQNGALKFDESKLQRERQRESVCVWEKGRNGQSTHVCFARFARVSCKRTTDARCGRA